MEKQSILHIFRLFPYQLSPRTDSKLLEDQMCLWLYVLLLEKCLKFSRLGFPAGTIGKEPACQCMRHKRLWLEPWVGKIHWRRAWQASLVFMPGEPMTEEPGGLWSIGLQRARYNGSDLTHTHTHTRIKMSKCRVSPFIDRKTEYCQDASS